ncbi:MAG TPA: hypothetical protein VFG31_05195 [Conexibacter sp.]|nr:hypothetical protein [Conexibacter sp.]
MTIGGAVEADESGCVLIEGNVLEYLRLAQAIRDADPAEILLRPLLDMTNALPLRAVVIRREAGAVRVELRDACAILSGGESERAVVAYRILDFIYWNELDDPWMHAHIDVEDGSLATGSRNIMLLGNVPDQ